MHPIEKELITKTGFSKEQSDYKSKQDYMAAMARVVDQLKEAEFDKLSEDAAKWFNAAAIAISDKKVIPDFADDEVADAEIPLPEPDEEPITEDALVEDGPDLPVRKTPPPKRKRAYDRTIPPPQVLPHLEVEEVLPGPQKKGNEAEVDKWGFTKGSKNAAAANMFERGCRMADVRETLGDNFYNVVRKLESRGHKVVHEANHVIRVTFRKPPGPKK